MTQNKSCRLGQGIQLLLYHPQNKGLNGWSVRGVLIFPTALESFARAAYFSN